MIITNPETKDKFTQFLKEAINTETEFKEKYLKTGWCIELNISYKIPIKNIGGIKGEDELICILALYQNPDKKEETKTFRGFINKSTKDSINEDTDAILKFFFKNALNKKEAILKKRLREKMK